MPIDGVDISPDSRVIAVIDLGGRVTFLDGRDLQPLGEPLTIGGLSGGDDVAFSPDGHFVLATNLGSLSYIDTERRALTRGQLRVGEFDASLVRSSGPRIAALGGASGRVTLVDVEEWRVVRRFDHPHYGLEFGLDTSPDGRFVASGGGDGRLVIDAVGGNGGQVVATGPGPIGGVDFSPDGRSLAVGFGDGTVVLVDVATGRSLGPPFGGHSGNVMAVRFSPDGSTLAVADHEGSATVWDVGARQRLGELVGHARPGRISGTNGLVFSPDGRSLATVGSDGSLVLWDLDPDHWASRACELAARNLTESEWQKFLGDRRYRRTCERWPAG